MKLGNGFFPLVRVRRARCRVLVPHQASLLASPRAGEPERRLPPTPPPAIEHRERATAKHLPFVRLDGSRAPSIGARRLEDETSLPRLEPETRGGIDHRPSDEARSAT